MININPKPNNKQHSSPYSREIKLALEKKKFNLNQEMKNHQVNYHYDDLKKSSQRKNLRSKILAGVIIIILLIAVGLSAKFMMIKNQVIVQNPSGSSPVLNTSKPENLTAAQVEKDGDTRINILLTGIGGKGHDGGSLTDSIQIFSIDPFNNTVGIVSLPRDFYLVLDDEISRKINTLYQIGEKKQVGGGGALMKKEVGKILDLKIHYFINIDFEGFSKLVDKIGGVKVFVEKAISDPQYPDRFLEGFEPFYLKSGWQTLDGGTALKYARSRKSTSDFDRSARQQQLMIALKEKAFSLGTLANPAKISDLMNIVGNHLRTDIQLKEAQALASRYNQVKSEEVKTIVIDNSSAGPLIDKNVNGSYSLVPKLGINKFTDIQKLAHTVLIDPKVLTEKASIEIIYSPNKKTQAQEILDFLTDYGYTIQDGGAILSNQIKSSSKIILRNDKIPFTAKYLKNRYSKFSFISEKQAIEESDITISWQ